MVVGVGFLMRPIDDHWCFELRVGEVAAVAPMVVFAVIKLFAVIGGDQNDGVFHHAERSDFI